MDTEEVLKEVWEKLEPFRNGMAKEFPNMRDITAVQFRGYNPKSVNAPKHQKTMTLWVNYTEKTRDHRVLLDGNRELLLEVWEKLMEMFDGDLDRVMIAPVGGVVFAPGIYPQPLSTNDQLPFYQPFK